MTNATITATMLPETRTHEERLTNFLLESVVDKTATVEENYRNLIAAAIEHANDGAAKGLQVGIVSYGNAANELQRRLNQARGTIQTILKKRDPETVNTPEALKWAIGYGGLVILGIYRPKKTNNSYTRDTNLASRFHEQGFEGLEAGDYIKFQAGDKVAQLELHYLDGNDWKLGAYTRRIIRNHKDALKRAAEAAAAKEIREAEEKARKLLEAKRETIDKDIRDAQKQLEELLKLKALDETPVAS